MKRYKIAQAWNGAEKCRQCSVRELALFAELRREDFEQLHLPIDDIELETDDTLYQQGHPPKYVYTLRSGQIKLVRYLSNGSYRIIRLLRQGDLAGIEALNDCAYLHHAIALQNTEICRIPVENIERLNRESPHLHHQLTTRWQKIQQDTDIWLAEFTVGSSRKRVASLLLYLASNQPEDYCYLPSREDIGALLAITTETASRTIAEFKRLGYIKTRRNSVQINQSQLEKIRQNI